jgi:hypothetical protein
MMQFREFKVSHPSVGGYFDFVIPSAFFLAREPALSGAEGNLLFHWSPMKSAVKTAHCPVHLYLFCHSASC